jgi:tRNA pseudouridine55 synthase
MNDFDNRVFVIDKHSGPTSFEVVDAFRAATGVRRVGHAGTLDPLARGVLLLCSGAATRVVEHFVDLGKWYEFEVRLGEGTATLDAEGEVTERVECPELAREELLSAAAGFVGECVLEPPAYSAIKRNGKRLYELARAGENPKVEGKRVRIYSLEITGIDLPSVRFRLNCSRGTYVRALARDFGARFGLPAHIRNLVRTAVGPYLAKDGFPSARIFERDLEGLEGIGLPDALGFLPGIVLNGAAGRALMNGVLPGPSDVVRTVGLKGDERAVRILGEDGGLLAVGTRSEGPGRNRLAWVDSYRLLVDAGRSAR